MNRICISCQWLQPPINFEVNIGQKVKISQKANLGHISKSSIFIQLSWNLKGIYISGHWIQPPTSFVVSIGKKVNIGQIYKIVKFHSIDLKFVQDIHISSLNSTTNYDWGQHRPKVQHQSKVNNLGAISKILNFHPIDLKFEQDFHRNDPNMSRGLSAILDPRENLWKSS